MQRTISVRHAHGATACAAAGLMALMTASALAQAPKLGDPPEAKNMRLVGHTDLHE